MQQTTAHFSRSEEAGLALLTPDMRQIYSVGISTGGIAEMRMAEMCPEARIVATTLDQKGVDFSERLITEAGLSDRIETKIENVAEPLAYPDGSFDYVYARLVLHYLTKQALPVALQGLHRILRPNSPLFVVVRSTECPDMQRQASYDPDTGLTRYIAFDGRVSYRQFHTQESISTAIRMAGFTIQSVDQYDEQLFADYERQQVAPHIDNVIQVIARK